jgi:hypothetical protein
VGRSLDLQSSNKPGQQSEASLSKMNERKKVREGGRKKRERGRKERRKGRKKKGRKHPHKTKTFKILNLITFSGVD